MSRLNFSPWKICLASANQKSSRFCSKIFRGSALKNFLASEDFFREASNRFPCSAFLMRLFRSFRAVRTTERFVDVRASFRVTARTYVNRSVLFALAGSQYSLFARFYGSALFAFSNFLFYAWLFF